MSNILGWISAAESKPPYRAEVLIYGSASYVTLGYYCGMGKWYTSAHDKLIEWAVSHWMVKPAPPAEAAIDQSIEQVDQSEQSIGQNRGAQA